jgi:phosphoribosyl 1,2-cyclic phosphodiesterase
MIRFSDPRERFEGKRDSWFMTKRPFSKSTWACLFCRVEAGLESLHKTKKDIQAILITHEHTDHVSGLSVERERPRLFSSKDTLPHPDKMLSNPAQSFTLGRFSKSRLFPFRMTRRIRSAFLIKAPRRKPGLCHGHRLSSR